MLVNLLGYSDLPFSFPVVEVISYRFFQLFVPCFVRSTTVESFMNCETFSGQ